MAQATRLPRYAGRLAARGQYFTRADLSLHTRHFRGRYHAAAIVAIAALVFVGFRLFPSHSLTVLSNGQAHHLAASLAGEEAGLRTAGLGLEPGDRLLLAQTSGHSTIAIDRATPVTVDVDGHRIQVRTQAATVAGALAQAGVELRRGDGVYIAGQAASPRGPLSLTSRFAARPGDPPPPAVGISVVRARPVVVYVNALRLETASAASNVEEVLAELGISVREADLVQPSPGSRLEAGTVVRLSHARTVNVRLDGKDQALYTQARTVADVLRLLGVTLGPEDAVEPAVETPVSANMQVVIALTRTLVEERVEPITPEVEFEVDTSLPAGALEVVEGAEGRFLRRFSVTYRNGVESAREEIAGGGVLEEAVPIRHISGPRPIAIPRPGDVPDYTGPRKATISMRATWYNATHGGKSRDHPAYGITFSGHFLDYGICAVDPTVIPLGTVVYVPGYGRCLASDIGGLVKGNTIDLGFPESAGNNPWATRWVDVIILD